MIIPQLIYPLCCDGHEVISEFWLVWTMLLWFSARRCVFLLNICTSRARSRGHRHTHFQYKIPPNDFPQGSADLHSHQLWVNLPVAPHPHQHLALSLLGKSILKGGMSLWYFWLSFPCVLVDISLMTFHSVSLLCALLWSVISSFLPSPPRPIKDVIKWTEVLNFIVVLYINL